MSRLLPILLLSLVTLLSGCRAFNEHYTRMETDPAYKAERLRFQRQMQANQEAQNRNFENTMNALTAPKPQFDYSQYQLQPRPKTYGPEKSPVPTAFPNTQQPNLPTSWDLQGASGRTGRTQYAPDGTLYYEYRSSAGTTFWSPAR